MRKLATLNGIREAGNALHMSRDIRLEILEKRQRHIKRARRWQQYGRRMFSVIEALNAVTKDRSVHPQVRAEVARYFPIAAVACLEGYYKMVYADLINAGDPYSSNATAFSEVRLGVKELLAVYRKQISVGEIIAHQLPHNRLGDIDKNITTLTGKDFLKELQDRRNLDALCKEATERQPAHPFKLIERTFELRHIFCHELATKVDPKIWEIRDTCFASLCLMMATEYLLADYLPRKSR